MYFREKHFQKFGIQVSFPKKMNQFCLYFEKQDGNV